MWLWWTAHSLAAGRTSLNENDVNELKKTKTFLLRQRLKNIETLIIKEDSKKRSYILAHTHTHTTRTHTRVRLLSLPVMADAFIKNGKTSGRRRPARCVCVLCVCNWRRPWGVNFRHLSKQADFTALGINGWIDVQFRCMDKRCLWEKVGMMAMHILEEGSNSAHLGNGWRSETCAVVLCDPPFSGWTTFLLLFFLSGCLRLLQSVHVWFKVTSNLWLHSLFCQSDALLH